MVAASGILAFGAIVPVVGIPAAGPTPPAARPRCAKLTVVSKPSNIPQTNIFFIPGSSADAVFLFVANQIGLVARDW
jgi:hypothetical protein